VLVLHLSFDYLFPGVFVIVSHRAKERCQQVLSRLNSEYSENTTLSLDPKRLFFRMWICIPSMRLYLRLNWSRLTFHIGETVRELKRDCGVSRILKLFAAKLGNPVEVSDNSPQRIVGLRCLSVSASTKKPDEQQLNTYHIIYKLHQQMVHCVDLVRRNVNGLWRYCSIQKFMCMELCIGIRYVGNCDRVSMFLQSMHEECCTFNQPRR
jgi:hypothetical protein